MLNTETTEVAEIIEPVEPVEASAISTTSRAVASARRKPELVAVPAGQQLAADQHSALAYLASLAPGSRRGVRSSLQVCAELLSSGSCDWQSMPWQALGPQHTQALRSELADRYAAATANKMLASVRGVYGLHGSWGRSTRTATSGLSAFGRCVGKHCHGAGLLVRASSVLFSLTA